MNARANHVYEASWEVCNKVGGIYTVVKTKAEAMQRHYNNYTLIGPYKEESARHEFTEEDPPENVRSAIESIKASCHYGTWNVDGDPTVILIEPPDVDVNALKEQLWRDHDIDSLNAGDEFDNALAWAWTVGELIQHLNQAHNGNAVLHCHEWLAGFALLNAHKAVNTVFTTHATILGRTLAATGRDLYNDLDAITPAEEARALNVEAKHTAERAAAQTADVFTTVSEVTALEAQHFLGRDVDVVLNNGMNTDRFPTIEETTMMHVKNRDIVREFLTYYFFPYYSFELEHNLIYYLVGRFEYTNKGIDVYIDALQRLNERLQEEDTERTITAFFFIPLETEGIREDVRENKHYYNHIKRILERNKDDIMDNLLQDVVSQRCTMEESIFTSDYLAEVENEVDMFKREGKPPITTHKLRDSDNPIINQLQANDLDNHADDKVKVILYPVYLDGEDNLLDLPYYDALSAGHLGVFPSYYEPWGYTPVEAMSLGVPAVTTDLAGFGRFIQDKTLEEHPGVYIQERFDQDRDAVVEGIYQTMYDFAMNDHAERVQNKINAKQMSKLVDWKHFAKNYVKAHNQALGSGKD